MFIQQLSHGCAFIISYFNMMKTTGFLAGHLISFYK